MTERSWYLLMGVFIALSLGVLVAEWHNEYLPRFSMYILFGAGTVFGYCVATVILNYIYDFIGDSTDEWRYININ